MKTHTYLRRVRKGDVASGGYKRPLSINPPVVKPAYACAIKERTVHMAGMTLVRGKACSF